MVRNQTIYECIRAVTSVHCCINYLQQVRALQARSKRLRVSLERNPDLATYCPNGTRQQQQS